MQAEQVLCKLPLQAMIENTTSVMYVKDKEGRYIFINQSFEELFQVTMEQVIGKTDYDVFPPTYADMFYINDSKVFQLGTLLELQEVFCHQDGPHIYTSIKSPIYDEKGMIHGLCSISTDITGSKQAEEILKKSYKILKKPVHPPMSLVLEHSMPIDAIYVDNLHSSNVEREQLQYIEEQLHEQAYCLNRTQDAIIVCNLDNEIVFWNRSAERIYGWTVLEAIGRDIRSILSDKPLSQWEEIQASLLRRGSWQGELEQISKTDKQVITQSHWSIIYDKKGQPKSKLIISTDITEKKALTTHILRAQRMESIGALAVGITHDLNNVLTPIVLGMQVLRRQVPGDRFQLILSALEESAKRGADMVKQVLSFVRGVKGERVMLQLKHLLIDIEKMLQETFPKSITIETNIQSDLWTVNADATQLFQVLMNLCVNARDAMPQGGKLIIEGENIVLDEKYTPQCSQFNQGQFVLITVRDNGLGIPADAISKIFDPFFTTKELDNGTGLGLFTSMAIIKSHGGFIDVHSEFGNGTQFKIYLPVSEKLKYKTVDEEIPEPFCGNGEVVLVVDDEVSIREVTQMALEANGYEVITASDGTEALTLYVKNREKIKLVLLDTMMPHLDGYTTAKILQQFDADIKIICTSGFTDDGKTNRAMPAKAFLPKPYTAKKLLHTIVTVLSANGQP